MSPRFDVFGIGLNATDTLILLHKFPPYAGKVPFAGELLSPGGQVATAMVCCARLGLRVKYAGTVGDDERGRVQLASLQETGIDLEDVLTRSNCPNQTAYILIDESTGERTVLWARNDCLRLRRDEIRREAVAQSRMLHLDGCDTHAAAQAAAYARELGIPVSLDVDTIYPDFQRVLANTDYLVASSEWPGQWTGESDPLRALELIQNEYGMRVAAMTLGAHGALARADGRYHYSPAYVVNTTDTTGAGDVFHGAFCYGVLCGQSLADTLDLANALAALNCTAIGARGRLATLQDARELANRAERRIYRDYEPYRTQ